MGSQGTDVLVIGGAVMGASVAFWLTRMQPGLRVTVVESDPSYARSSTALSAASIRQQFSNPVNVQISRFGVEFIRDFQGSLGQDVGVPSLGLKENGYLFLAESAEGAALMEDLAAMQRGLGAETAVLSPAEIAARFPWIETAGLSAGSYGARLEGWFDNMGLLAGFRAAARAQGAQFVIDRVIGLERLEGRVVAAVLEKAGRMEAARFICAAGTGAAAVLEMLDEELPVEPRKRTVFVVDAPNARHPEAPMVIDPAGYWMRPEHSQWLTATVPSEDGPCAPDDFEPDAAQFEDLIWEKIWNRVPGFDQAKVTRLWAGHYAYNTLDQNAILGLHPHLANFYLMNGFSGHGLQQAPAVGRGIAELVLTGSYQSLDLSPLGVERVLERRPFLEQAIV
ncbi:NAD(P)/FAD-dependent oxidoreductase [Frigidibacter mobilis]|uniref:Glycine/D-amino acid oxidase n=1 Tax=Frigidibacter mobilis TaxID=1335048 RepID=A0A159Z2W8_9RHOB|nr:FAD-binding oxidoreductase [Frigidibacter mobilis]AMY68508.1 glycine/D-amino acid oxidase [Frigidibacter mobilis]